MRGIIGMMVRPWNFFGGYNYQESEAHEILDNFFDQILTFINEQLEVNVEDYTNINELVSSQLSNREESIVYFWNWLDNTGINLISNILQSKLSQSDEFLDLLDHRLYILEMDIESQIKDSVYHSIADSLKSINDFLEIINQSAAAIEDRKIGHGTVITDLVNNDLNSNYYVWVNSKVNMDTNNTWNLLNPAEIRQDFCYYLDKE